jgi:hypothetical protein
MLNNIDKLVHSATIKAIKDILEGNLKKEQDEAERDRQRQQFDDAKSRGVIAPKSGSKKTDEAEEDEDQKTKPDDQEIIDSKGSDKQKDRTKGKGTADSPKLKTPKRNTLEEPTVGSMIDKLNAMRGGKSLKDVNVKKSFTQYFDGLTTSERQSLLVFLTGIAQILAGTEKGAEAIDPGDVGLRVKGDVNKTSEKQDTQPKLSNVSNREGTSDNPIVVGESPDKSTILRALKEYRKHDAS